MEAVWIALIVLGFALVVGLIMMIRFPEEVRALLRRTESVEVTKTGLAWRFYSEAVRKKEDREPTLEEIEPDLERITSGRLLWVDDSAENNRLEIQALRALGIDIDTASSNGEAVRYATQRQYDLVLSDIGRSAPQEPEAGLALPALLREAGSNAPVAYYVGTATAPTTPSGQSVFDTPTELLHFVAATLGRAG